MPAIKILVVEDDLLIAEEICSALHKAGYQVSAVADSCAGALEAAKKEAPDLVFMDIKISGESDGIETAEKLRKLGDFPIIFLTNLHDKPTMERAMRVNPANYLAKPFTAQQLLVSIQHALLNFSEKKVASISPGIPVNEDIIPLKGVVFIRDSNGNYKKQEIADIHYVEADRSYCTIYTGEGKYVQSTNMSNIMKKMNHEQLVQVSRSHFVNIHKIEQIKGNTLFVAGTEITVTDKYREGFFKHINMVK
ncbi:MAG: LytR/AlgR family response regulator transcription factor [Bacteroidia bacterium]